MTRKNVEFECELRDPSLAALLREAYADDPALAPSPGRTERIMRAVKTTGRRGVHAVWSSFAWGVGATAVAAVLVAFILGMSQPRGTQIATPDLPKPSVIVTDNSKQKPDSAPKVPTFATVPQEPLAPPDMTIAKTPKTPVEEKAPQAPWIDTPRDRQPDAPGNNMPDHEEVIVAAALYNVGKMAYQYGDYESAYAAFEDSYDTMPTPEAALGTGNVLVRMAQEQLAALET